MHVLLYLALGFFCGSFGGLIGAGSGILLIPLLVLSGFSQHQAQGIALAAFLPPITALAAWDYYQKGYVDVNVASLVCVGLFLGYLFGAHIATNLSDAVLEKVFGAVLLAFAIKILFFKQ